MNTINLLRNHVIVIWSGCLQIFQFMCSIARQSHVLLLLLLFFTPGSKDPRG